MMTVKCLIWIEWLGYSFTLSFDHVRQGVMRQRECLISIRLFKPFNIQALVRGIYLVLKNERIQIGPEFLIESKLIDSSVSRTEN